MQSLPSSLRSGPAPRARGSLCALPPSSQGRLLTVSRISIFSCSKDTCGRPAGAHFNMLTSAETAFPDEGMFIHRNRGRTPPCSGATVQHSRWRVEPWEPEKTSTLLKSKLRNPACFLGQWLQVLAAYQNSWRSGKLRWPCSTQTHLTPLRVLCF